MIKTEREFHFSRSDLSNHYECGHLPQLNLDDIEGILEMPGYFNTDAEDLQQRRREFEIGYLVFLKETVSSISNSQFANCETQI